MNNSGINNPNDFYNLSPEERKSLIKWITHKLGRSDQVYKKASSFYFKDCFENADNGFFVTNGQFKGALLEAEYRIDDKKKMNWHANFSIQRVKILEEKLNGKS